jgi:Nif-specific regulatory protein
MKPHLDILTAIAAAVAEPAGVRTDSQRIIDHLHDGLEALFGFCIVENAESGELTVAAAQGIDAAAFRRLETRLSRSALVRIFDKGESEEILVNDEPSLDFLIVEGAVAEVFSVPVFLNSSCVGSVSIALDKRERHDRRAIRQLLSAAASLISVSIRMDRLAREAAGREMEQDVAQRQEMQDRFSLENLIGNSNQMRQVIGQIDQVARSNANVLLRGEGGTGKEFIASAIHYGSLRSKRPFVKAAVSSLPPEAIEAELFGGHDLSAGERMGRLDDAEGGTLFIDEIADLPDAAQAKLLRLIETREFSRPGGQASIRSNVRVIAASRCPLEERIASGEFLEPLFYRISMFSIFLPPLRERKSDVLLLAEYFIDKYEREHNKRIRRISTPAIDMLTAYHFPGNVRELENTIERAVIACDSGVIHGRHLPPTLQTAEASSTETTMSLTAAVESFERDLILDALKSSRGNIAKAARALATTERILGYKIKNYGIDTIRFRR